MSSDCCRLAYRGPRAATKRRDPSRRDLPRNSLESYLRDQTSPWISTYRNTTTSGRSRPRQGHRGWTPESIQGINALSVTRTRSAKIFTPGAIFEHGASLVDPSTFFLFQGTPFIFYGCKPLPKVDAHDDHKTSYVIANKSYNAT